MESDAFEILMMVALGTLAGTGLGLFFGFVAKKQKNEWSAMTRKEQIISISLIIVFSIICSAALGYYYFMYSGFS
jgi:flagellar basal body-associated protein FliL